MGIRGQTTQDFAIGTSVLLVTIIGVFFFLQTGGLSVYEGTSPGVRQPQADRVASYIVTNYSTDEGRNILDYDTLNDDLTADEGADKILDGVINSAGVDVDTDRRTDPILNVSVVNGSTLQDGRRTPATTTAGTQLAWGEYRRAEAATSTRVVSLTGYDCESVCWVVVRVW